MSQSQTSPQAHEQVSAAFSGELDLEDLQFLSDQQAEMMVGGYGGNTPDIIGYLNPGGKFFSALPGNSTSGQAKDNWTPVYREVP